MSSLYREQLERWVRKINVKCDSCLDIGGGQKKIKDRVNSWQVKTYKILDNDKQYKSDYFFDLNEEIRLAKEGRVKNEKMKIDLPVMIPIRFDVVFCLEVMEYVWNPVVAHENVFDFLKPGGIAYLSYPTIYPLHNPPGVDYLRYTKNAIEKYLTEIGFKSWEITPRIATDGLDSLADFYSHERMRAMKETNEIFDLGYMCKVFK